jgi:hypothetical protein
MVYIVKEQRSGTYLQSYGLHVGAIFTSDKALAHPFYQRVKARAVVNLLKAYDKVEHAAPQLSLLIVDRSKI